MAQLLSQGSWGLAPQVTQGMASLVGTAVALLPRGSPWRGREDLPSQRRARGAEASSHLAHEAVLQPQLRGQTSLPLPTLGSCVLQFC